MNMGRHRKTAKQTPQTHGAHLRTAMRVPSSKVPFVSISILATQLTRTTLHCMRAHVGIGGHRIAQKIDAKLFPSVMVNRNENARVNLLIHKRTFECIFRIRHSQIHNHKSYSLNIRLEFTQMYCDRIWIEFKIDDAHASVVADEKQQRRQSIAVAETKVLRLSVRST